MSTIANIIRTITLAVGLLALGTAATFAQADTGMELRALAEPQHTVLDVVHFDDGTSFEFVMSAEDGIFGVAELAPLGVPSRLIQLSAQSGTPLEIFLAVAAERRPPDDLVADHERTVVKLGRSSTRPRELVFVDRGGTSEAIISEDYVPDECEFVQGLNPGDSWFTRIWFLDLGQHQDFTGQQMYNDEHLNGTTGWTWAAGQSWQRWLSACNGTYVFGFPAIDFYAQYKNGTWKTAYHTQVEPDFKVTYSSLFGAWHWRLKLSEGDLYNVFNIRDYGAAVAGNRPIDSFKPE